MGSLSEHIRLFFNLQGIYFGLAMIAVKIAHELGHALVAKHHGLRVSSMGVAFLVLFPVLYTDNTDAWRLTNQQKKLQIVLAGLSVELHIALLAIFSWGFLDDGPARSVAFFLATTSILGSLLVNLAHLCVLMGIMLLQIFWVCKTQPNFLWRWQVRRWLFGLPENAPEPFPGINTTFLFSALQLGFIAFSYSLASRYLFIFLLLNCWGYSIVEIIWFIALDLQRIQGLVAEEVCLRNFQTRRSLVVFGLLILSFAPWRQLFPFR